MSADTIYLYPPGIPMIVPGEIITRRLAVILRNAYHLDCVWNE